jgi:hypothetical protein
MVSVGQCQIHVRDMIDFYARWEAAYFRPLAHNRGAYVIEGQATPGNFLSEGLWEKSIPSSATPFIVSTHRPKTLGIKAISQRRKYEQTRIR